MRKMYSLGICALDSGAQGREPMLGVTYKAHSECKCYNLVNCKYCELWNIADTMKPEQGLWTWYYLKTSLQGETRQRTKEAKGTFLKTSTIKKSLSVNDTHVKTIIFSF